MSCVIALWLNQPFSEIDARYGLTKSAQLRATLSPSEDIILLMLRGIEHMDKRSIARLRELKYKVVDASSLLKEVRRDCSFANESRIWQKKGRSAASQFHEMCFLRFLVIERFFGDSPVLTMDGDVVWRTEPYQLFDKWKSGGSFFCHGSTFMVFIKGKSWYDSYRDGLKSLAEDPGFGAEYTKPNVHFTGIYHDQALCQYLTLKGRIENDVSNFMGHGFADRYMFNGNPLSFPKKDLPLTFEQDASGERINGKHIPFWHMQTTFSIYLFSAMLIPALTGRTYFRVPYERKTKDLPTDLAALMLAQMYSRMTQGRLVFTDKLKELSTFVNRETMYERFFHGTLAKEIFTEAKWWKSGVWAS